MMVEKIRPLSTATRLSKINRLHI